MSKRIIIRKSQPLAIMLGIAIDSEEIAIGLLFWVIEFKFKAIELKK